jgi:hypothetical protein
MSPHVDAALIRIEHALQEAARALIEGEPGPIESAAVNLCDVSRRLHALNPSINSNSLNSQDMRCRLRTLAETMAVLREGLSRRSVSVERALSCMLPASQSPTYTKTSSAYSQPGRQSGAFKVLAA